MKTLAVILLLPWAVIAADTNALPPLVPAYGEIPPTFWEQYRALVIPGAFVFVFLLTWGVWFLLKPKPPVVLSPAFVAREALKKLQPQPEDGRVLSEISQIFRRYVGAVFSFPAGEMTTAEFSAVLAAHPKAGLQVAEVLSTFLRACDKDKFTAHNAAPPLNAVGRALQLVEQIESGWREVPASKSIPR
ncbi:MAG TPA: hypothetical protein VK742_12670 [Candidatus Sulfotelmatobacter sp.]|jgi:hypothetical protein|nr:hypothetical protein [Candidatus Sulfotelmatobacter sp.]